MNEGKVKLTCPACGANQFTRGQYGIFECNYCGTAWKFKEDGRIEGGGYRRCKCGQINSPSSIYCQHCKARLKINCPNCGNLIDLEANYCPNCMVKIAEALETKYLSQINQIENEIAGKEAEINRLQHHIESSKQVAQKLNFLGKSGLNDEERSIFMGLNANVGCLSPALLTILAMIIVDLIARPILINLTGYSSPSYSSLPGNEAINEVITFFVLSLWSLYY
jgi:RNA polymerase subunit RPABC4/transcription elongation factor Spt4